MRTLRGNISNENGDISDSKNQTKSKRKTEDDDVGASGDETTDDEGGVDTPPPTCEEDEDSKDNESNDLEGSIEKEKDEIKDKDKINGDKKHNEKKSNEKKNKEAKNTKTKGDEQKKAKKIKEKKNNEAEEEEYEVEQIVDMETNQRWKCPVKFRVRWVGFTEKEDSWLSASVLSCDELIKEFLEISGRKSEHERAYEAKKKAAEWINDNYRQSARKTSKVTYSELDEDEEEILPSGTKSRKVKTKAEKKQMPVMPVKRKAKKSPVRPIPSKKSKSKKEDIYEVESIVEHRVKNRLMYYKVRWRGVGPQHDSWVPENECNCSLFVKEYHEQLHSNQIQPEEFQVESISGMREVKGKVEYKVHWKNWGPKHDSWLREDELNCPELLTNFKESLDKVEKEEDWQVEKILDEREKKGKKEYFVHWKGFEAKHDTWEPEENLSGCPEILNSFKLKNQKVKPKLQAEKRRTREEKPQTERFSENNADSPRSRSKRRSAATSYSEFYEQ